MPNNTFNETLNYLDDVYRSAYYLTHNNNEAEDLVQEVYLKAYASWDQFEPGTNSKTWIFKILYNTHINRLKRKGQEPSVLPPEKPDALPVTISSSPTELKKIVEELVGDEIDKAMKNMPTEYTDTLILAWLGNFSYAEIVEILDCPIGTVMSRLSMARLLLRNNLNEYWEEKHHGH